MESTFRSSVEQAEAALLQPRLDPTSEEELIWQLLTNAPVTATSLQISRGPTTVK
jgi:hypothetical protein